MIDMLLATSLRPPYLTSQLQPRLSLVAIKIYKQSYITL